MSETTQEQIKMLLKRGTPKHDPRVQGLERRLVAEKEALNKAKQTAQQLKEK